MKKMFFQFQAEKMAKVLVLSVLFFFVGIASINAQYLGADESIAILKADVESFTNDYDNSPSLEVKSNLLLKINYYSAIIVDLAEGENTGAAIQDNKPAYMPKVHASGWVSIDQNSAAFKQNVENMVNEVETLLSE